MLLCFLLLAGCATTSTITVKTDPAGADIYVDGKRIGQTPATIEMKFAENAQMVSERKILAVKLSGYRERREIIFPEGTSQKTLERASPQRSAFSQQSCMNEKRARLIDAPGPIWFRD